MYSYEYLRELSDFPHRGSCTLFEKEAAKYIYKEMGGIGFKNVIVQKFKSPKDGMYTLPIQFSLLIVLAGILLLFNVNCMYLSLLLILPVLMIFFEVTGSFVEINLLPKHDSQNVIAFDEIRKGKPTIIISAHYDTQKGSVLFSPKFQKYLQRFFDITFIGFASIILAIVIKDFSITSNIISIILDVIGIIIVLTSIGFLFYSNKTGDYVNGANDNGTGTALTMSLAKKFKEQGLESSKEVNYIFLMTGSEEVGSKGMKAFLKEYRKELDKENTYFIVIDNIGSGKITYLEGEGVVISRPYSKFLKDTANKLKKKYDLQKLKNRLLPTDSLPVMNQGFKSISFLGKDENGKIDNYHWFTDTIDKIDEKHLNISEEFFVEYIKLLSEQILRKSTGMTWIED